MLSAFSVVQTAVMRWMVLPAIHRVMDLRLDPLIKAVAAIDGRASLLDQEMRIRVEDADATRARMEEEIKLLRRKTDDLAAQTALCLAKLTAK